MPHTSSVYNAICLCTLCHRTADSMNTGSKRSKKYRQRLLKKVLHAVTNSEYQIKQKDKDFLLYIDEDIQDILSGV